VFRAAAVEPAASRIVAAAAAVAAAAVIAAAAYCERTKTALRLTSAWVSPLSIYADDSAVQSVAFR
jgi:TRAP-type mannitol/chloroaromatic compound transport system substrate-binding protein